MHANTAICIVVDLLQFYHLDIWLCQDTFLCYSSVVAFRQFMGHLRCHSFNALLYVIVITQKRGSSSPVPCWWSPGGLAPHVIVGGSYVQGPVEARDSYGLQLAKKQWPAAKDLLDQAGSACSRAKLAACILLGMADVFDMPVTHRGAMFLPHVSVRSSPTA